MVVLQTSFSLFEMFFDFAIGFDFVVVKTMLWFINMLELPEKDVFALNVFPKTFFSWVME